MAIPKWTSSESMHDPELANEVTADEQYSEEELRCLNDDNRRMAEWEEFEQAEADARTSREYQRLSQTIAKHHSEMMSAHAQTNQNIKDFASDMMARFECALQERAAAFEDQIKSMSRTNEELMALLKRLYGSLQERSHPGRLNGSAADLVVEHLQRPSATGAAIASHMA